MAVYQEPEGFGQGEATDLYKNTTEEPMAAPPPPSLPTGITLAAAPPPPPLPAGITLTAAPTPPPLPAGFSAAPAQAPQVPPAPPLPTLPPAQATQVPPAPPLPKLPPVQASVQPVQTQVQPVQPVYAPQYRPQQVKYAKPKKKHTFLKIIAVAVPVLAVLFAVVLFASYKKHHLNVVDLTDEERNAVITGLQLDSAPENTVDMKEYDGYISEEGIIR